MKFSDDIFHTKFHINAYVKPQPPQQPPPPPPPISDSEGLQKAYHQPNKLFAHNGTLYVGGTKTLQDVWDDLKIPFGMTGYSQRYHDANGVLEYNKNIHTVVGHSLGGAVALQLQKDQPNRKYKTRTYGAPVMSFTGGERFRNVADPVSFFDFGAKTNYNVFDLGLAIPHDYKNIGRDKFSNEREMGLKE